jgi:hypothetical protein
VEERTLEDAIAERQRIAEEKGEVVEIDDDDDIASQVVQIIDADAPHPPSSSL